MDQELPVYVREQAECHSHLKKAARYCVGGPLMEH